MKNCAITNNKPNKLYEQTNFCKNVDRNSRLQHFKAGYTIVKANFNAVNAENSNKLLYQCK